MFLSESVSEYRSGHQKSFPFFFFFFSFGSGSQELPAGTLSLSLPGYSCFLSSRVFLRPSVAWRRDDLSSCLSIWLLCNSPEFSVSCHSGGAQSPADPPPLFRADAIFPGLCFVLLYLGAELWFQTLVLCLHLGQFDLKVPVGGALLLEVSFIFAVSHRELWFHVFDLLLWRVDIISALSRLSWWHFRFSLCFSSHLMFLWKANKGLPFWSFLPCLPAVSSAGP